MKIIALLLPFLFYTSAFGQQLNRCQTFFIESEEALSQILQARDTVNSRVLGQQDLVQKVFIAFLTGGHVLLNGPTGVAKTTLVNSLANLFNGDFKKEQFTIDTSPTDLKGYDYFDPIKGRSKFIKGSLFGNFVLIDEVNRAQPKTQNAMLSAMEEGYVLVNGRARRLPEIFFIMATQNSEGSVGTYALPEAQLDRLLFRLDVTYTDMEIERLIVNQAQERLRQRNSGFKSEDSQSKYGLEVILASRQHILEVQIPDPIQDYILRIIEITREAYKYPTVKKYLAAPVGPRATLGITLAAQANAWLSGRNQVTLEDVNYIVKDVLRHRIALTKEAQHEKVTTDQLIEDILKIAGF